MVTVSVYRPGTQVFLDGNIPAIITAVVIYETGYQYQVAWWAGKERKTDYIQQYEITNVLPNTVAQQIGLK